MCICKWICWKQNELTPCPLAPLESLLLKYTIQPMINNVGVNLITSFLWTINSNGNQDYKLCTFENLWLYRVPWNFICKNNSAANIFNKLEHTCMNEWETLGDTTAVYSCFEKGCLVNATMSKVIMGNGGFTVAWLNLKLQGVSAWWKETAETRIRSFPFLVAGSHLLPIMPTAHTLSHFSRTTFVETTVYLLQTTENPH